MGRDPAGRALTRWTISRPWGKLALGVIFFGAGALFMHHRAATNDRGLIINGLIELGVHGAKIFYWSLAALSAAFVVVCIFYGMPQLLIRRRITMDEDAITLPARGFSAAHYRIPWGEIESVSRSTYEKMTFLKIRHRGRRFSVNSTWLPSNGDIEIIERFIDRKCGPLR